MDGELFPFGLHRVGARSDGDAVGENRAGKVGFQMAVKGEQRRFHPLEIGAEDDFNNGKIGLDDFPEDKKAKIALVVCAKTAIKNGLALLGMEAPERM